MVNPRKGCKMLKSIVFFGGGNTFERWVCGEK